MYPVINLVGRIVLGLYFVYSGYNHFKNGKGMVGYAASKKVPSPAIAVYGSGALLVLGGLGLAFNYERDMALLLLVIFIVPVTIFMHDYWKETEPMARMSQRVNFLKNVALLGAVLALF